MTFSRPTLPTRPLAAAPSAWRDARGSRRWRSLAAALLAATAPLACADAPLEGPGLSADRPQLRMQPRFEAKASVSAFSVTHVHVVVRRVPGGEMVFDTTAVFGTGPGGSAALDLEVPLLSAGDRFQVRLAAADAAGDTIFRATDTVAVERGSAPAAPAHEVLLRYSGPDTRFAAIQVGPRDTTMTAGHELGFWAVGRRAGSAAVEPLSHVAWTSSDPEAVAVSLTGGLVSARAAGRSAWIRARTAAGLHDSVRVTVRQTVASVAVEPAAVSLTAGASQTLTATPRDPAGQPVAGEAIGWSSADPAIATISASGTLTAVAPGTTTVAATAAGVTGQATVTVAAAPVAAVVVNPPTLSLSTGQNGQVEAHGVTAQGQTVHDAEPTFTSSAPAVATVTDDGSVTAVSPGSATITATIAGKTGSVAVTVTAPPADAVVLSPAAVTIASGANRTMQAQVTDATGKPVTGTDVVWSSADPTVATVSATGIVVAVGTGTTTITATATGRTGQATVTVLPAPVASVAVEPAALSMTVGGGRQLTATPRDAGGSPLAGRAVSYSSNMPTVATVSAQGFVTAVGAGSATITATSEGKSGTASVVVQAVPVASVSVSPAGVSLAPGKTQQYAATARDADGTVLTGRPATWHSSNTAVATITADGKATTVAPGSATITATVGGVPGTATLTVVAPETRSVRVTPGTATVAVGETAQLAAQAFIGMATTPGTFTWTSRTPAVASVNATGKVTPLGAGQSWIVANDQTGAADSALVTAIERQPLAFSVGEATIGHHQHWGIAASPLQVCRPSADASALPVRLKSTDDAKAELPATTVTIAAGQRCATFDVQGNGSGGATRIVATATADGGIEWTPDTMTVTVAQPRLKLEVPGSLQDGQGVSVTVRVLGPDGFPRITTGAVPVQLSSSATGVAAWATSTITIPADAGSATASLDIVGAGNATLTAKDSRTGAPHRYSDYTQTVSATAAPSGGMLSISPSSYSYALGQTVAGQRVKLSGLISLLPLGVSLSSSNTATATVSSIVALLPGQEKKFQVTGHKKGSVTITASFLGLSSGTATVQVQEARLAAEGWEGNLKEGDNIRVRFYAAGADGLAMNSATFATATNFRVRHNENIEVHLDKNPGGKVGSVGNNQHAGRVHDGSTMRPDVGEEWFTLIIKGKKKGKGTLTIETPDGSYISLNLQDLNVYKGGGGDDDD